MTAGQLGEAIAFLTDSITLNIAKDSPLGLAFNRQTLGTLAKAAAQAHDPGAERLQGALADVEGRLTQAESVLGRVRLPGEYGDQTVAPPQGTALGHPALFGASDSMQSYAPRGEF